MMGLLTLMNTLHIKNCNLLQTWFLIIFVSLIFPKLLNCINYKVNNSARTETLKKLVGRKLKEIYLLLIKYH